MTVILLILKIIAILILSLLGIALLLLALLLFVPVRYRIRGEHGEQIRIEGRLHWLFHLLGAFVSLQNKEWKYGLSLCGFSLRLAGKKNGDSDEEASPPKSEKKINVKEEDAKKHNFKNNNFKNNNFQNNNFQEKNSKGENSKEKDIKDEELREADASESDGEEASETETGRPSAIKRLKHTIERVLRALKKLPEKIADIKKLLTDETNQKSVSFLFAELRYLLKHSRFRRIKTELTISFGDPAATGMAFGVLSMIPLAYQKEIRLYPDFEAEKAYVEGYYEVRGHIRLVHPAVSLLRLWRKKEFRKFIKHILKQLER